MTPPESDTPRTDALAVKVRGIHVIPGPAPKVREIIEDVEAVRQLERELAARKGYVLVPVEPTEAMREAGDLFFTNPSFVSVSPAQIAAIYRACLAAAPSATNEEGKDGE